MTGHGQCLIMRRWVHEFYARTQRSPKGRRSFESSRISARRRRNDGKPVHEEVCIGEVRSAFLRTGKRVAADKVNGTRKSVFRVAYNLRFCAAGVSQQRPRPAPDCAACHLIGNAIHGRAKNCKVSSMHGCFEIQNAVINGARRLGAIETGLLPPHTQDALSQATTFGCQADGAADQPDADDGEDLDFHQRSGSVIEFQPTLAL